jgi:exodeoxyribonuclease VII large subunit
MLKVLDGRVQVTLFPTRVQGDGAPEAIVRGIEMLNQREDLDLLIVGRGGGSLEDLWCFNDEAVARAIFKSRLPVISAVGHEKDVSIADLTADCRAATPTKAAELVIACRAQAFSRLDAVLQEPAFTEPEEWVAELKERVEEIQEQLVDGLWDPILQTANRLGLLHSDLLGCSPQAVILQQAERLHGLQQSLESGMARSLESAAARFMRLTSQLNALSPLAVLERGYSITFDSHGKIIKKADAVKPGDVIQTRLHKGRLTSRVEKRED